MRTVPVLALFAAAFAIPAWSQPAPDEAAITRTALRDGLYLLQGDGGNMVASVGSDGVFLVDDQFAEVSDAIRAAIAEVSDQPVRFLANTHWHGDHTGGNENFGKQHTVIIAQDGVRTRMSQPQALKRFPTPKPAAPTAALPVLTFDQGMTLHLNGQTITLEHAAHAHTDGDALVHYQPADVLHMGDTFFNGMYPFIDLETGGSIDGIIAAANRGLAIAGPDTLIVPGHGPLSDRADLQRYRDVLVDLRGQVAHLMAQGKNRQQVLDAKPSAAYDKDLGQGFISPDELIGTIYDSLGSIAMTVPPSKQTKAH